MITASVVLYKTPEHQLSRLWDCIKGSSVVPHLYVVDNSPISTDHPILHDPRITYVKAERNAGYGGGHNVALRMVLESSEFHFVLNPDIHFASEELEKMIGFMHQDVNIGQLMPRVVYEDGS